MLRAGASLHPSVVLDDYVVRMILVTFFVTDLVALFAALLARLMRRFGWASHDAARGSQRRRGQYTDEYDCSAHPRGTCNRDAIAERSPQVAGTGQSDFVLMFKMAVPSFGAG